jgi:cytochrome c oxidase subunit 4
MSVRWPPRAVALSFAALIALLALTVTLAYQPLGRLNGPAALLIATTKALLVLLIFMELRHRRGVTVAAAIAGVCWLAVLIWLSSMDFALRASGL